MHSMPKLLSALLATGFVLSLSTGFAQNTDPYKQRDTTGASKEQSDAAMKQKLKECRKLSGQAKQDCIKDVQAGQSGAAPDAGTKQPEPQSGQAPVPSETKRRQQQ